MTTQFACDLPGLAGGRDYTADPQLPATRAMDGFLYHGARLEAVIAAVKVLRADPRLAARLLTEGRK